MAGQWMIMRRSALLLLGRPTATAGHAPVPVVAKASLALRCLASTSSISSRRLRNHPKNVQNQTRNEQDGEADGETTSVANRELFASAGSKTNGKVSHKQQGSHSHSHGHSKGKGKDPLKEADKHPQHQHPRHRAPAHVNHRNKKTPGAATKHSASEPTVFTNKFQNLLSFAFEDAEPEVEKAAADSSKTTQPKKTKAKSKKPKMNKFLQGESADLDMAALGLEADGVEISSEEHMEVEVEETVGRGALFNKQQPKRRTPKKKRSPLFSPTSDPSAVLSALGINPDSDRDTRNDRKAQRAPSPGAGSRKALKQITKRKKDGRNLLKNFQFENSIFDEDSDLFTDIDWEDRHDVDSRERRRSQRRMRKESKHPPKPINVTPQEVEIPTKVTVKDLAERMSVKTRVVLRALRDLGEGRLKEDSVLLSEVAELVVEAQNMIPVLLPPDFVDLELTTPPEDCSAFPTRPPVVSVMGHVDHGKTTLLDALRKSKVAASEAGGITQRIGAFSVNLGKKFGAQSKMTFIDTPGHAAFSNMRSRGSELTDLLVLVVAADDGVRPQTVEVAQLALKNEVPLVVAITKCDMHEHDQSEVRNRISDELLNHGIVVESMGGDTPMVCVSGKTGEGLDTLKETIALHAEMLDLRADTAAMGEAVVLEANVARGVGTQVDAIVKWGTFKNGTHVVCGLEHGKVRALMDESGKRVKTMGPGYAVRVIGLKGLPDGGNALLAVESEERAKEVVAQRQAMVEWDLMATAEDNEMEGSGEASPRRRRKYAGSRRKWEQVEMRRREAAEEAKRVAALRPGDEGYVANVVPIMVKTDSVGVIAAIDELIASLPSDEAMIKNIMSGVGPVTSSDLAMAEATGATIYSFNVRHPASIDHEALQKEVSLRTHRVVYSLLDDIKELLSENLGGVVEQQVLGTAEVIQSIPIGGSGRRTSNIAGCKVTSGSLNMQAQYRIVRDGEIIADNVAMESMRHFQQKVSEVNKGQECGLQLVENDDFQPGDVLEAYTSKVVKQEL